MQYGAISGLWIGEGHPRLHTELANLYSGALYLEGDENPLHDHTLYVYSILPPATTGSWIPVAGEGGGVGVTISDDDPDDDVGNDEDFWFNRTDSSLWIYDNDEWKRITLPIPSDDGSYVLNVDGNDIDWLPAPEGSATTVAVSVTI